MNEIRRFKVDPHIIYSLIVAQAGTLAKAVLECVMNSVDAHATRLDITVDAKSIRIRDDGHGFRSRAEIEERFEVFGFSHEEGERIYGKFGLGRGQLWSFCSTVWRTGTFQMDVDIKQRGIEYSLQDGLPFCQGVDITGSFYSTMLTSDLAAFERELTELALFAQIPVMLNGRRINRDPATESWDHETPDAWIKVSDIGQLSVYNLGVLVRRYPRFQFGCGGVVVTRPGVALAVNMARNDVLVAECAVWKRIRKVLQEKSDAGMRGKRTRMTEVELENVARRFVARELSFADVMQTKMITDIVGRGHPLMTLAFGVRRAVPLTVAALGSRIGERAHSARLAFVLSPQTLERFGVDTVQELRAALCQALGRSCAALRQHLERMQVADTLQVAVPTLSEQCEVLKPKELTPKDRAALGALESLTFDVGRALRDAKLISRAVSNRTVRLGSSDVAEAWTDGSKEVVIERGQLELMHQGIGGFSGLANLLVHEYLHDSSDVGSHTHDQEFYARYHDATCSSRGVLHQAVYRGLRAWVQALHSFKLKVPPIVARHLDEIEKAARESAAASE